MPSRSAQGPTLIPLHGPGEHKPRTLDRDAATIGRARGCDVIVDASDVSTIHCVLYRSADGYHVRDCNSRTGTRINGEVIRGTQVLRDADILQIGPFSFELRVAEVGPDAVAANPENVRRLQESRRRLAGHALRLRRLHREPSGASTQEAELQRETGRLREKIQTYERRLAELNDADRDFDADRQEFDKMKAQFDEAQATLDKQRAVLAQQESAIKVQRAELARMMTELRQLQEELRRPHKAELQALSAENERLRQTVADYTARLAEAAHAAVPSRQLEDARAEVQLLQELLDQKGQVLSETQAQLDAALTGAGNGAEVEPLQAENDQLKQLLAEKDVLVEELRIQAAPKPLKNATELERYEAELNEFRQQLENDRTKLMCEIEQLRQRNLELDEAMREMEMEMSRERAEMGRERIRLERMRDELKTDMEKIQREMSVRESLAPVQRLREEMAQKKQPAPGTNDRLRALRHATDTPRG